MPCSRRPSLFLKSNRMRWPHRYSACCGLAFVIFFDVLEVGTGHAQVGELDECLAREEELVRLGGLHRIAERRILVDDFLQLVRPRVRRSPPSSCTRRTPRASPAWTDRSSGARPPRRRARRPARPVRADRREAHRRLGPHVAEADLVLAADAVREIARRDPSSGSSHRSYRCWTMTDLPSLV